MIDNDRAILAALWPPRKATHWDGCWREHRDCFALHLLERAERAEKALAWIEVDEQP